MHREQAANALERETPAELNGRKFGVDQREQRLTRAARDLGGDQPERLQCEVDELQLQHASVFALGVVVLEEPAPRHPSCIDRKASAGWRLEADIQVDQTQIASMENDLEFDT